MEEEISKRCNDLVVADFQVLATHENKISSKILFYPEMAKFAKNDFAFSKIKNRIATYNCRTL